MQLEERKNKGQFNTNFGFLMACLGSAVGLGNLWQFPYKLGIGGGFAFLLVYLILCVAVGYPLVLSEIALGRKSEKAAIQAYGSINKKFKIVGILQTICPFFLICFYCTFGGYITKYLIASIEGLSGTAPINTTDAGAFFEQNCLTNGGNAFIWVFVFLAITVAIVLGGVAGGIERFCNFAMPALTVMLLIVVVRGLTLPGSFEGLSFLFKPHFEGFTSAAGIFNTFKLAGSQMFFSLCIASGCLIAYGSYQPKDQNLEFNALAITAGDTVMAILAGLAIMPACSATGLEPAAGPSLLFVSMTTVFQSMGYFGRILQVLFWLLVLFAALTSSIGMMEGGVSAMLDSRTRNGKTLSRFGCTIFMGSIACIGNLMTTLDCLGAGGIMDWFHILGQSDVLSVWDALGEGLIMPLSGLAMAIILGWIVPHYLDDEVLIGSKFKSKKFYDFCIKWVGPLFMIMIVYGQISDFFIK